jgi:glycosyltransferase involved in cell wall biosynthesis
LKNSIKVLIIGQIPPIINGQSLVTKSVLDILVEADYEVVFLPLTNLNHGRSLSLILDKFTYYLKIIFRFLKQTVSGNYIIYLNGARSIGGTFRNVPFLIISKILRNKTILHFHCGDIDDFVNSQNKIVKFFLLSAYKLVDKLIILSPTLRKNFSQIINKDNLVIIENGISSPFYNSKVIRESEVIKLLYLSNLILSKGYFDILIALDHIVNKLKFKNIECNFCGEFLTSYDDPELNSIEKMKRDFHNYISQNNLINNVNYKMQVLDEEKNKLLNESHILILPTNYSTEAQPLSIIEAISRGNVIISTNFRAIPDMVVDNYNGKFVAFGDPLSIVQNILFFINNPTDFNNYSKNSISIYQKTFTYDRFKDKILLLFDQTSKPFE